MFLRSVMLLSLLCVCSVLALDSATVVNGINTAGQVGQAVAQASGQPDIAAIIASVTGLITTVLAAIFGHRHGRATKK